MNYIKFNVQLYLWLVQKALSTYPNALLKWQKKIQPHLVQLEIFENAGAAVYKDAPEASFDVVRGLLNISDSLVVGALLANGIWLR